MDELKIELIDNEATSCKLSMLKEKLKSGLTVGSSTFVEKLKIQLEYLVNV